MGERSAPPPKGVSVAPDCNKCSGGMELLTVLPALDDRPDFHIFRCIVCGFVDWIVEATEN